MRSVNQARRLRDETLRDEMPFHSYSGITYFRRPLAELCKPLLPIRIHRIRHCFTALDAIKTPSVDEDDDEMENDGR